MSHLLDTNACIALINGNPSAVRRALERAVSHGAEVAVSPITVFELWYGVAKSARPEVNAERLTVFLAYPRVTPLDDEDARIAGGIRAELERTGRPIGAYDLLIAAQAVRHGLILVTASVREFRRVKGLRWEDWAT